MSTYYVSNSGSDTNNGTSTSTPWKTLAKITSEITAGTFLPGDSILLNRGDSWNEDFVIDSLNGNSSNYITFGAYGTGNLPEITCEADLPGWNTSSNWNSSTTDLWDISFTTQNDKIRRLWIDGVEEGQCWWYDKLFVYETGTIENFADAPGSNQWSDTPNSTFKWKGGPSSASSIQVYSTSNPATNFTSMKFYTSRSDIISVKNSSYLIFENIKTTGGSYASLIIRGGHDIEIKNNDFCDRATGSGVVVRTDSGIDAYNVKIHDNTINSRYTRYDPYRYGNIQFGVEFNYGAHDCEVYNNDILNIVEAALYVLTHLDYYDSPCHHITFRDNYVNGSGNRYAVGVNMQGGGTGSSGNDSAPHDIHIYRNKFYYTTKNSQYGVKDSYIHHNIYYNNWGQDTATATGDLIRINHHAEGCTPGASNTGPNGECYGKWEVLDELCAPFDLLPEGTTGTGSTHFFNNTLYNIGTYGIFQNSAYYNCFLSNNLLINTNRWLSSTGHPNDWRWVIYTYYTNNGHTIKNNCINNKFSSYNDEYIGYGALEGGTYYMTVPDFNLADVNGDVVDGNYLSIEAITALITEATFSLPIGSSALNAGVDITSYMTGLTGFTDINGNTVDLTAPNIGAIDNDPTVTQFSVSIAQTPANPVTESYLVTYTCTTDATTPTYQWYKNNVAVGTNSDTYSFTAVLDDNGSTIKCDVSDGTSDKYSNVLTLEVNASGGTSTTPGTPATAIGASVFGTGSPKFVYDYGGANEFTIFFDYVYDYSFKPKTTYIEHESEIDLERNYIFRGSHWTFEFKMNLFKYLSPVTKHDEINSYKGKAGSLWMHRDGNQFKKTDGTDALFVLKEIIPFYRETASFKDGLYLKFESLSPVDLGQGSTSSLQLENIAMTNGY